MLLRDIIGQEKLKHQLVEMVQHQRLSHALLFVGPEGSGALPLAIAFAQYLVSSPATTNEVLDLFADPDALTKQVHTYNTFHFQLLQRNLVKKISVQIL
jgi:DNA polymerase-3 subunit delta'